MKRHFRFNLMTRHYSYIIDESDTCYIYVTITHAPWTFKRKNIKLNSSNQYIIPTINILEKNMFGKYATTSKFKRSDGPILRKLYKETRYNSRRNTL